MKSIKKLLAVISAVICLVCIFSVTSLHVSAAKSIFGAKIAAISNQVYTGKSIKPAVTVKYGSKTLTKGTHYTVTYSNNKNVGYATVKITGKGSYTGTKTATFKIVCKPVSSLKLTSVSFTSVKLGWKAVPQATKYEVWLYDSITSKYVKTKTTSTNYVTIKGLKAGSTIKTRVRAYKVLSNGKTLYGAYSYIYIKTASAKPTSLYQTSAATTYGKVSWTKMKGATGYMLYTAPVGSSKYTLYGKYTGTSATIKGLSPASTLKVRVRTYRTVNGYDYKSSYCTTLVMQTLPSQKITELKVDSVDVSSVALSWTALSGKVKYAVYSSTNNGKTWSLNSTLTANSCTLKNLSSCKEYSFKVSPCVISNGKTINGKYSPVANAVTKPGNVTNLTATEVANNYAALAWNATSGQTGYSVEYIKPGTADYTVYSTSKENKLTVKELAELSEYSFRVRAYYTTSAGATLYGNYSNVVTAKTDDSVLDGITVSSTADTVWVDETITMSAQAKPTYAVMPNFKWYSDNAKIAKIDEATGVVTGVAAGTAYIYARSADGLMTSNLYKVTVSCTVKSIKLEKTSLTLALNEGTALAYTVLPYNASNKKLTFKSSNTSILTVSSTGYIKAVGTGTATITVTSADVSTVKASCKITVSKAAVTGIALPSVLTIYVGQAYKIQPTFSPSTATNQSFTISFSNKLSYKASSYISVNGSTITGLKSTSGAFAPGNFTMTVKSADGSRTANCNVNVISASSKKTVTDISISSSTAMWYPGTTAYLSTAITPADATDKSVTWTSSNNSVARVDAKGKVLCVSPGKATITATTTDQAKKATYVVNVVQRVKVTGIKLSLSSCSLTVGETRVISATLSPSVANDLTYSWKTSNKDVVTISGSGVLTAVGSGSATVTATANDGGKTATCTVSVVDLQIVGTDYFEGLAVGDTKQFSAAFLPATTAETLVWSSSDTNVATVTANGLVTIVGEGKAYINVCAQSNPNIKDRAIVRTDAYVLPESKPSVLYNKVYNGMKDIKSTKHPQAMIVDSFSIDDFTIADAPWWLSKDLISDTIEESLQSDDSVTTDKIPANSATSTYNSKLPLRGWNVCLLSGFDTSCLDTQKTKVIDNGSTYTIVLALNKEVLSPLPTRAADTNHGKIFDIFTKSDIDGMTKEMTSAGLTFKYDSIGATYENCTLTVTIDKLSDNVVKAVYDQNLKIDIENCNIGYSLFTLESSIGVAASSHIDITYNYD